MDARNALTEASDNETMMLRRAAPARRGRPQGLTAALLPPRQRIDDDSPRRVVAEFEAGRLRVRQQPDGVIEIVVRVWPEHRRALFAAMDYAQGPMSVTVAVPRGAIRDPSAVRSVAPHGFTM